MNLSPLAQLVLVISLLVTCVLNALSLFCSYMIYRNDWRYKIDIKYYAQLHKDAKDRGVI